MASGRKIDSNILEKFQDALDLSPACAVITGLPGEKILYYNKAVLKFIECNSKNSKEAERLLKASREYSAENNLLDGDAAALGRALYHGETVDNEEMVIELENGTRKWISTTVTPVRDSDGNIIAAIKTWIDITRERLGAGEKHSDNFDFLTGVYSRGKLMEMGERAFQRARHDKGPFTVLSLDIDSFRKVNDNFGHAVGDQVIREFSAAITGHIRTSDIFGRLSGTKFLAILPETAPTNGKIVADKTRKLVEEMPFDTASGVASLTVSIGVAGMSKRKPAGSFEELYRKAEEALVDAKSKGGNRTGTGKA